jgi:hypothetical protein
MLLMMVIGGVNTAKNQSKEILTLGMETLPQPIFSCF